MPEENEINYTLTGPVNYKLKGKNMITVLKKELQASLNLAMEINHEKFEVDKLQLETVIKYLKDSLSVL